MKLNKKLFILGAVATTLFASSFTVFAASTKEDRLAQKKEVLDERVEDGQLTKEKAVEIYNAIKENQENCTGDGSARIGQKYGVHFGNGQNCDGNGQNCTGNGQNRTGNGQNRTGNGQNRGGNGNRRNGSCRLADAN